MASVAGCDTEHSPKKDKEASSTETPEAALVFDPKVNGAIEVIPPKVEAPGEDERDSKCDLDSRSDCCSDQSKEDMLLQMEKLLRCSDSTDRAATEEFDGGAVTVERTCDGESSDEHSSIASSANTDSLASFLSYPSTGDKDISRKDKCNPDVTKENESNTEVNSVSMEKRKSQDHGSAKDCEENETADPMVVDTSQNRFRILRVFEDPDEFPVGLPDDQYHHCGNTVCVTRGPGLKTCKMMDTGEVFMLAFEKHGMEAPNVPLDELTRQMSEKHERLQQRIIQERCPCVVAEPLPPEVATPLSRSRGASSESWEEAGEPRRPFRIPRPQLGQQRGVNEDEDEKPTRYQIHQQHNLDEDKHEKTVENSTDSVPDSSLLTPSHEPVAEGDVRPHHTSNTQDVDNEAAWKELMVNMQVQYQKQLQEICSQHQNNMIAMQQQLRDQVTEMIQNQSWTSQPDSNTHRTPGRAASPRVASSPIQRPQSAPEQFNSTTSSTNVLGATQDEENLRKLLIDAMKKRNQKVHEMSAFASPIKEVPEGAQGDAEYYYNPEQPMTSDTSYLLPTEKSYNISDEQHETHNNEQYSIEATTHNRRSSVNQNENNNPSRVIHEQTLQRQLDIQPVEHYTSTFARANKDPIQEQLNNYHSLLSKLPSVTDRLSADQVSPRANNTNASNNLRKDMDLNDSIQRYGAGALGHSSLYIPRVLSRSLSGYTVDDPLRPSTASDADRIQRLRAKHERHLDDLKVYYEAELSELQLQLQRRQVSPTEQQIASSPIYTALRDHTDHLTLQLSAVCGTVEAQKKQIATLESQLTEEGNQRSLADQEAQRLQQEMARMAMLQAERERLADELEERNKRLARSLDETKRSHEEKSKALSREQGLLAKVIAEYEALSREHDAVRKTLNDTENKLYDSRTEIDTANRQIVKLVMELQRLERETNAMTYNQRNNNRAAGVSQSYDVSMMPAAGAAASPYRPYLNKSPNSPEDRPEVVNRPSAYPPDIQEARRLLGLQDVELPVPAIQKNQDTAKSSPGHTPPHSDGVVESPIIRAEAQRLGGNEAEAGRSDERGGNWSAPRGQDRYKAGRSSTPPGRRSTRDRPMGRESPTGGRASGVGVTNGTSRPAGYRQQRQQQPPGSPRNKQYTSRSAAGSPQQSAAGAGRGKRNNASANNDNDVPLSTGDSLRERMRIIRDLQERMDFLSGQRQQLQSSLSRLPRAGVRHNLHARQKQEGLEEELDAVEHELGSVRMSLKKFNVLKSAS